MPSARVSARVRMRKHPAGKVHPNRIVYDYSQRSNKSWVSRCSTIVGEGAASRTKKQIGSRTPRMNRVA